MNYKKDYEKLKKEFKKQTRRLNTIIKQSDHLINEINRQKHEIEKLANAKSEFLANMSHEIRTPLNAIMGFIQVMKDEDDGAFKKYLDIMDSSSKTLLTIINDILDHSKIEAGKMSVEEIDFDISELENIVELFRNEADKKSIIYNLHFSSDTKYLRGDIYRIKQVISNLLSNAIKFTPANKAITITINHYQDELFVEVKDEGIGIPEDKLATIFDIFTQVDNSISRKYGGSGLGLAISYKLIELLGGELKVESKEGEGSRFYFTIPLSKGSKPTSKENLSINNTKLKILIAEDNKANQMFMKILFKKLNIDYKIVSNGKEVIDILDQEEFSVILMDINMPILDGIETTKIIRQKSDIPIIALTASVLKDEKDRYIENGMNGVLEKPLSIEKLKEVLENIN
jgi:CheY-like chemotaxis protein